MQDYIRAKIEPGAFSGEVAYQIYCIGEDSQLTTYHGCCPKHYVVVEERLIKVTVKSIDYEANLATISVPSVQQYETITVYPNQIISKKT